ncbi:hypothetical protein CBL_05082 [Carabus blaptoides fortunei]
MPSPDIHGLTPRAQGTAYLIKFMDELFDSVNGTRASNQTNVRELRQCITQRSRHIQFWKEAKQTLHSMKFVKKAGSDAIIRKDSELPPSLTNWIATLNGFGYLWKTLVNNGFSSVNLRGFNQDPLENFFGSIRSHLGCNTNPTSAAFVSSFKTLCINNFVSANFFGCNCEQDCDHMFTDLKKLLISAESNMPDPTTNTPITTTLNLTAENDPLRGMNKKSISFYFK